MNTERKTIEKLVETAKSAATKAPPSYQQLMKAAKDAAELSYSPYSQYAVGAALLTQDGKIFSGCNVENASYGGTICAERTAIVKAVSEGNKQFKAIAVYCKRSPGGWPCGLCRQFILEFGLDIEVVVENAEGEIESMKMRELVPHAFGPEALQT